MNIVSSCPLNNTESKKGIKENSDVSSMDDSSTLIIDRAIAYAGGYDTWQQKKSLSFDKKSIYYDSTGKVTKENDMHLDYMTKPAFKAKLTCSKMIPPLPFFTMVKKR